MNPCPPEGLDREEVAVLRADAIGSTVYTPKWILKCLVTITEVVYSLFKDQTIEFRLYIYNLNKYLLYIITYKFHLA